MRRNHQHSLMLSIVLLLLVGGGAQSAEADSPSAGNILVSHNNTLYEFTPAGVQVQSWPVPYGGGTRPGTESARDIVLDPNERWQKSTFLRYLRYLYDRFFYRSKIEFYKNQCYEEMYTITNEIKAYFNLQRFM